MSTNPKPEKMTLLQQVIEVAVMILVAIGLALLIRAFLVEPYKIPTGSMIPTIEIGDQVLVDKLSYHFRSPKVGEIVTFADPTGEFKTLIKRVIATEGQVIDIRGDKLYIDDVEQPASKYAHGQPTTVLNYSKITYPYTVPKGELWFMGDNRTNSGDSRVFGAQPIKSVTGHGFLTYWPLSRFGILK